MRFDNDKGEVILYWKGQVPHRMVVVRTLRTSVPVRVVERPCSLVELQREARRLVEFDLSGAGVNVTQAGRSTVCPGPPDLTKSRTFELRFKLAV